MNVTFKINTSHWQPLTIAAEADQNMNGTAQQTVLFSFSIILYQRFGELRLLASYVMHRNVQPQNFMEIAFQKSK